jgi:hypothetical protein
MFLVDQSGIRSLGLGSRSPRIFVLGESDLGPTNTVEYIHNLAFLGLRAPLSFLKEITGRIWTAHHSENGAFLRIHIAIFHRQTDVPKYVHDLVAPNVNPLL